MKQKIYIHVNLATHFLEWELPEFKKYFEISPNPGPTIPLLCFGPDALEETSKIPASKRFAVLFPGFGFNPLYNLEVRKKQIELIKNNFEAIFINPGPLEIAYKELKNVHFYPFSVNTDLVGLRGYRKELNSLIHVSNNGLQKDWERSQRIMDLTHLKNEVFPPRDDEYLARKVRFNEAKNKTRELFGLQRKNYLPKGYVNHKMVVKKYQDYDGFVHVARDIKHNELIDGKYTASLIEAGITGSILFWHDTLGLGNTLETVFNLPLDEKKAAEQILDIRRSINIEQHSKRTREEMLSTFNPEISVRIRAEKIIEYLE